MNNTTLQDIADKLHLSKSTVSRALKDHADISPATKELVKSLAEELDYHPNLIAQGLSRRETKTIGVIIPEIVHEFFASIISGIEEVANERGYSIILTQSNEKYTREVCNLRTLISKQVDGLVVSISQETKDGEHFKIALNRGIPIVFMNRVCKDIQDFNASKVLVDDYAGAIAVVEHLINAGHKRIAHFAGPQAISVSQNRLKGYRDALQKHFLPIDENLIISGGFSEEDGVLAFHKLLCLNVPMPDAIFTVNDPVAIGTMIKLKEHGFKVPDDIAIAGFSDDRVSSFMDPPLTTVRQPTFEIGKTAIKLLLKQLDHKNGKFHPQTNILCTELIVREST